jgi:O-methyltransferase involved in polyketide biosynthesis
MFRRLLMSSCLCVVSAALASTVMAQVIGQPYRLSDEDVEKIIHRIEQQSDTFRASLDDALDKSRFNGSSREDDINAFVKDFYEETKKLHDRFDDHKSTAPDVQSVLERAARIDGFMRRVPLTSRAQDDWSTLKTALDELAAAYDVSWRWGFDNSTGYPPASGGYPSGSETTPTGTVVSGIPYRVTDREVEQILHRIEQQSDKFRSAVDEALDKSRLNGTQREDEINAFVKDFYSQTKTLHDHFDDHKSTSADVQSVLERASRIDAFMRRHRLRRNAEKEWSNLKTNLDELARVYNVTWRWDY